MSIITLTSDFGNLDYRVAAVKGKILSLNPEVNIIDITHDIQAFNLIQTSYIVRNAYKYFPKGSIHILSVDSFHHKSRKNIIYKADGSYFLAADNGLLSLIFFDIKLNYNKFIHFLVCQYVNLKDIIILKSLNSISN